METSPSAGRRAYDPLTWFKWGAVILLSLTLLSTLIYWLLGQYYGKDWTPLDCLFMTVVTLTTIGYGDWLGIKDLPLAMWYTILLMCVSFAVPAFVISNLTALIVEGLFSDVFRRRRMERSISDLKDHIIICGAGTTGLHCIQELIRTSRRFVVVDINAEQITFASKELGEFLHIVGPADDDEVLKHAGVERAFGLIACLTDDKDNLFVTLSARRLNPMLTIVSKAIDDLAGPKLRSAGANRTVNPTAIGGLRMVSELVRPTVVTFLDEMLRDRRNAYRFEELAVQAGSSVENKTLADANLRSVGDVLVVAARPPGSTEFVYNPKASLALTAGTTIVLLGRTQDLEALHPCFSA